MQKKDCFFLGTVFKLHGYKGKVNIYNNENITLNFSLLEYFLIELNNDLIPFFVEKIQLTKTNVFLVKFKDIDSEETAKKIQKRKVYLPNNWIQKTDNNKITKNKLIGYSVFDVKLGNLGKIIHINSQTSQQLVYVNQNTKKFCFPMHKQFVKEVNSDKKIMKVEIPKDIINLN